MNNRGILVPIDEVDFSYIEDEDLPPYSPRPPIFARCEAVKDASDKRQQKDREAYLLRHPEIYRLLTLFEIEILSRKPSNISDFGAKFFSDKTLYEQVGIDKPKI